MKVKTKQPGRPRVHQSNAERQAAYRERRQAATPTAPNFRALAIALHESVKDAADCGDVAALDALGANPEQTLKKLTEKFSAAIVYDFKPL